MTHVMVPDGVLPWWLSAAGWLAALALLGFALWRLRGQPAAQMVPLVGVVTALMVVIMSFELVPIGYELHFTVLAGVLVGPWYGVIVALLFNVLRAMLGDGAFTNIGLNTVITWLEIALGATMWALLRPLARRRAGLAAGLATFASLLIATVAFVGLIALSAIDPGELVESGAFDVQAGGFAESPLAGGLLSVHLAESHAGERAGGGGRGLEPASRAGGGGRGVEPAGRTEAGGAVGAGFVAFAGAILILGTIGALIEAVVVGAVVAFIARVRPALLGLPALSAPIPA